MPTSQSLVTALMGAVDFRLQEAYKFCFTLSPLSPLPPSQHLKAKAAEECRPQLGEVNKQLAELGYA